MLTKFKIYKSQFPNREFKQAIDLSLVCSVYDNGGIIDVMMENGEKIQLIREGFTYDTFVDMVNEQQAKKSIQKYG